MLCSALHPKPDDGQGRFTNEDDIDSRLMRYQTLSPEDDESYLNAEERKGILHLVQGWIQRGHPEKVSILASLTSLPLIVMNHPGSFFISRIHAQRLRPWCNPVLVCSDCSYRPHNVGYV